MSTKWKDLRESQRRVRTGKNKGKAFERLIADRFTVIMNSPIEAREMGQPGSDLKDSRGALPWAYTELKHHDGYPSLNSLIDLLDPTKGQQVFIVKANRKPILVVMELEILEQLLEVYAVHKGLHNENYSG